MDKKEYKNVSLTGLVIIFLVVMSPTFFFTVPIWVELLLAGLAGWYARQITHYSLILYNAAKISLNKWLTNKA